ncbi:MAG: winged helix-turn-helix domain-containing protein [Alphaproteobacteria bacterium]|nr:winged helix-turn-helix domain-containing protein [Alphaproteobacteria bacterium]
MKWRIGAYTACSDSDMLIGDGVQHKLERRAMETLVLLCAQAGQVVKKDELIEAVWGRLAVSDHSVAMVICQLRRAFGDDARAPTYIETITKRGYRLIAPCEVVVDAPAPRLVPMPVAPPRVIAMPVAASQTMLVLFAGLTLASVGALSAVLLL